MNTAREVILNWSAKLMSNQPYAQSFAAVYQFEITGAAGGTWLFSLKDPFSIEQGTGNADCKISIDSNDFVDLANGRGNPQVAFLEGKIGLEGDTSLALKLVDLMS